MLFTLGKLVVRGYGLLLAMAIGSLVFANLFGLVAFFVLTLEWASDRLQAPSTDSLLWWMHCGWFVGAGLAFYGWIHRLRNNSQTITRKLGNQIAKSVKKSVNETDLDESNKDYERKRRGKQSGILSAMGIFSFFGGFLGLMLGGSLLLFWFSLTYSPFAPAGWTSSVSVEQKQDPSTGHTQSMMTTKHPMAFYLFGTPIVLGITVGVLAGGIGAAMGKVEDVE